ncbi:MAG TPA: hypothetical protein VEB86_02930, partial [Chryseosolibacter sp.]|nr:hypothetical protein [Chryseosolibacter sp.]
MKKLINLAAIFIVCATTVFAQDDEEHPRNTDHITISKAVALFQLRKPDTEPLILKTGNLSYISKPVQFVNARIYTTYAPVVMKGMPSRV